MSFQRFYAFANQCRGRHVAPGWVLPLLACLVAVCVGVDRTNAQDFSDFSGFQEIAGIEDMYGEIGVSGIPGGSLAENYSFSALLAPVRKENETSDNPDVNTPDAYLVVRARIASGWDLYTITQPSGGPLRGEFAIDRSGDFTLLEPLRAACDVSIKYEEAIYPGVRIESHRESADWIAPIRLAPGVSLDALRVSGTFDGQICAELCIQINDARFTAVYDPEFDVRPLLKKADEVAMLLADADRDSKNSATPSENSNEKTGDLEFKPRETQEIDGIVGVLAFAFLGGLILNVMPCVLPVIGLKILSFFEQAGKSRRRAFVLNLWYTFGILLVFTVLAFLSVALNRMFSYDLFNIIMACVVFAMALSLMEVWELRVPGFLGSGTSVALMEKEGAPGAVFKGVITTLLAVPCGAPLLSGALLWAENQIRAGATGHVFLAYMFIGLGMASPFLLIGAFPELLRFMPKPGLWMDTFKKTMGFLLLSAVIWIFSYLSMEMIVPTLAVLFALWFTCWYVGRLEFTVPARTRLRAWGVALLVMAVTIFFSFDVSGPANPYTLQNAMRYRLNAGKDREHWGPFTAAKMEDALNRDRPVLVDFTADWCMSCKFFEATVLDTEEILELIDRKGVASLRADCTKTELEGARFLKKLGSESVPVLALFDPKRPDEPTVVRGGFTRNTVVTLLEPLEDTGVIP